MPRTLFPRFLVVALLLLTLSHCAKKKANDPTPTPPPPTGTTTVPVISSTTAPTASALTATSATVSGSIGTSGGAAITQHGFVYSKTAQTPTLADSKTELGATNGPFPLAISSNLTGLEANTTYYVRAYATNAKGTGYGAVGQLKTEATAVAGEITGTWVERAKFPADPRGYNYHLLPVNGKIYLLCGGRTKDNNYNLERFYDAWEYDPATDKWTQKAKTSITYSAIFFPQIRPLVANGKIFFPSAVGPRPSDVKVNIHEFDPVANQWTVKGALPADVDPAGTTAFVLGDKAYFLGHNSSKGFVKKVWEYNIPTDKWLQKADFPGAVDRSGIGASLNGKGLAIGLTASGTSFSSWQYDPTTDTWTTIGQQNRDYLQFSSTGSELGFSADKIIQYSYTKPKTTGITPNVLTLNPFQRLVPPQKTPIPHPIPCSGSLAAGMTFVHVGERVFVMIDEGYQQPSAWTACEKDAMGRLFELVKK